MEEETICIASAIVQIERTAIAVPVMPEQTHKDRIVLKWLNA